MDAYIPYQKFENRLDLDAPRHPASPSPPYNMEFRYQQHQATLKAAEKVNEADAQFGRLFGRSYGGMVRPIAATTPRPSSSRWAAWPVPPAAWVGRPA